MAISAISCLDTRYIEDVRPLIGVCDEFAYYRERIFIELEYFKKLTKLDIRYDTNRDFTHDDFKNILERERILRHDVKAIEYFIKDIPEIKSSGKSHLIHVGLTSQDVCSPAFIICFDNAINIILEKLSHFQNIFTERLINTPAANQYMTGFTHGQPATPTSFQKEMRIYSQRLDNISGELRNLITQGLTVKFGGATGEMNAMKFAMPDISWENWTDTFILEISKGRYKRSKYTNQCDNYDSVCQVLYTVKRLLHILEHLRGNIWLYIFHGYLTQIAISREIGSSTMPNKVNPIDLENAKTAIEMAKRMIDGVCDILNETALQRDVSDSSALRNIGSVFGYVLIAIKKMNVGIGRLCINGDRIREELESHPEVILEGIQTYLKIHCGIENSYEIMKNISRGNKISLLDIHNTIDILSITDQDKTRLKLLTPENYIGVFTERN